MPSAHTPSSHSHDHPETCEHECAHGHTHHHHWWQSHWFKGFVGVLWGFALLVLSFLGLSIPVIAIYLITAATALVTLYLGSQIYISAIKELFLNHSKKLSMNALYAISTLTILAVSIAGFFFPWLPLMVEGAPMILGIFHIGEAIEHSLKKKITSNLKVTDQVPIGVTKIHKLEGTIVNFPVQKLKPGDEIEIKPGDIIPVDGICLSDTKIIPKAFNGSPFPKNFKKDEIVKSGMRLTKGTSHLRIKVTHTVEDSYLSSVQNKIQTAQAQKAPIQNFTDTLFKYFVPTILIIAIIASILIGNFFTIELAIIAAIALLVSPCPCTLKAITPLAIQIGISKAANEAIHYTSGAALQAAKKIDRVVFDLDGTLNIGAGKVLAHEILDPEITPAEFFQYIKLLEANNEDWIAKTLYDFASKQTHQESKMEISHLDASRKYGLKVTIGQKTVMIGNAKMFEETGRIPPVKKENQPAHYIYIAIDDKIIGTITVANPLRPDARLTVDALNSSGKKVYICTGSHQDTANEYAEALGIPLCNVYANCNSEKTTKQSIIQKLQANGRYKVAMVGDTINDLEGLKTADLGMVIRSHEENDDVTEKNADVVIYSQSLMSVKTGFDIGQQTNRNILQNLFISLTYNISITFIGASAIFIPLLGFVLNPVVGIGLMVVETILVLMNILFFKNQKFSSEPTFNGSSTYTQLCGCWPSRSNEETNQLLLENKKDLSCSSSHFQQGTHAKKGSKTKKNNDEEQINHNNGFATI